MWRIMLKIKDDELIFLQNTDKFSQEDSFVFQNCDYRVLLKKMASVKMQVDCIFTDPPYNISRSHQLGFSNMGRAGMDYGKWDYGFNQKEWIEECLPFLKSGGSIIIFNDWKNFSHLVEALELGGCAIKDLLRWEKRNPMPRNVNARYLSDCEFALWAVKGKGKWTFNKPKDLPYLKPSFKSGVVAGGKKRLHPTQKHLDIVEEILRIHTNQNDRVFDPFSGSATIALACLKNQRKFIGSEIDEKYFQLAKQRLLKESNGRFPS